MRAAASIAIALGLGACTPAAEPSEEPAATAPTAPAAASTPASKRSASPSIAPRAPAQLIPAGELIGEWRVAGVDGQAIDALYAITASITPDRVHIVADCINVAWSYAAESGSITTQRVPVEGCGRGLSPHEEAIVAVIDGSTGFGRVPSNAVEIFHPQGRVTLFSQ